MEVFIAFLQWYVASIRLMQRFCAALAFIGLFVCLIFISSPSFASNELAQTFTLDGQLMIAGTTTALTDSAAVVKVDILDPSKTCILYEEQQSVNTSSSDGYFSMQVGSITGAAKRTTSDPGLTMAQIFQNTTSVVATSAPGATCTSGTYTPAANASRYFRITVTPSSTNVADVLSPDTTIDAAPMAMVAQSLQGYAATDFLAKAGLPTCTSGTFLTYDGTNMTCATGATTTGSYSTSGNISTTGTGTITSASTITSTGSLIDNSTTASTSSTTGALTVAGGVGVAGALNTGSTITSTSNITSGADFFAAYGTAAAPSYSYSSDKTTGVFAPAAQTLAFSVGGTEDMRIISNGNVGIGTTSPVSTLNIGTAPTASANFGSLSMGGAPFDGATSGYFIGNASGTALAINTASTYTGDLANFEMAGSSLFKVDSSGNVTASNVKPLYQSYPTNYSSYSGGSWQKFATINVGAQYNLLSTYIDVAGAGSWFTDGHAELFLFTKHQYLGTPYVELVLIGSSYPLSSRDFGYVVNSNGANTTIDLWFQSEIGGDVYQFQQRNLYASGSSMQIFNNPASQSSAPASLQTIVNSGFYYRGTTASVYSEGGLGTAWYGQGSDPFPNAGLSASQNISLAPAVAATSSSNNSSPYLYFNSTYWNGSANAYDNWTVQNLLGTGTNPTSTLSFAHSGTSGTARYAFMNGTVGIGTTSPATTFDVETTDSSAGFRLGVTTPTAARYPTMSMTVYGANLGTYPTYAFQSAGGTLASPVATAANTVLGIIVGQGQYDTTPGHFRSGADMLFEASAAFTTTSNPGYMIFRTTPAGSINPLERVRIDTTGNVGIGTTAPGYLLSVAGDVSIASANALRFGATSVCTSTGCTASSDRRLKDNIRPLKDSLEKILQLQGVEFDYKDKAQFTDKHQIGVIAQDVEKIYPEVVTTDEKTGFKAVAYDHLIAPVIEAVKTLFDRSEKQSRQIASLQAENKSLKNQNAENTKLIMDLQNRLERLEKSSSENSKK